MLCKAQDDADFLETFHKWACEAAITWESVDALSTTSRRNLEESCWAATRSPPLVQMTETTPLLAQVIKLANEKPDLLNTNIFDLRASDFRQLAQWQYIILGLGPQHYNNLRHLMITLKSGARVHSPNESSDGY